MKIVKNMAAQGDCIFRRVASVPENAKELKVSGSIVVAHSETGHHHAVDAMHARYFEVPGSSLVAYLQMGDTVAGGLDVVHHRPFDTHETLRLLGKKDDVWEIRRQREWTPEGWRRVED